jgi:5'-nucleotidase
MIVQELEGEIETRERLAGPLERLREEIQRREHLDLLRDGLDRTIRGDAPPGLHGLGRSEAIRLREGIDRQMRALEEAVRKLESGIETAHNPHWGQIFRTDHEPSHFAAQVSEFACIYTCRVSNFLHYPLAKYFQVYPEVMPHER